MAILGTVLEEIRELLEHFWKTLSVPDGRLAKHRRADQELDLWTGLGTGSQLGQEVDDDGLNPESHGRRSLRRSHEVGDARDNASVGFRANRLKRGTEQGSTTALNHLRTVHHSTVATIVSVHMTLDVGVADQSHAARLSHSHGTSSLFLDLI